MKLKFFAYCIFIIICISSSLYMHFPRETASKYIEQKFSKIYPSLQLQMAGVQLSFPPGIKAESIHINYAGTLVATLDKFRYFVDLDTILSNKLGTGSFKAYAYDGIISGIVHISGKNSGNIETNLNNLKLKKIHLDNFFHDCSFSGIVNGKIKTKIKAGYILKNNGELKFRNMVFNFPETLFSIHKYPFSTGQIKFSSDKHNTIKIKKSTIKGLQADIHLSGEIYTNDRFQQSRLNIKVKIVLHPEFFIDAGDSIPVNLTTTGLNNAVINLSIGGTIKNSIITVERGKNR